MAIGQRRVLGDFQRNIGGRQAPLADGVHQEIPVLRILQVGRRHIDAHIQRGVLPQPAVQIAQSLRGHLARQVAAQPHRLGQRHEDAGRHVLPAAGPPAGQGFKARQPARGELAQGLVMDLYVAAKNGLAQFGLGAVRVQAPHDAQASQTGQGQGAHHRQHHRGQREPGIGPDARYDAEVRFRLGRACPRPPFRRQPAAGTSVLRRQLQIMRPAETPEHMSAITRDEFGIDAGTRLGKAVEGARRGKYHDAAVRRHVPGDPAVHDIGLAHPYLQAVAQAERRRGQLITVRQFTPGRGAHQHAVLDAADIPEEGGIEEQHPQGGHIRLRTQCGGVRRRGHQPLAFVGYAQRVGQQPGIVPGKLVVDLVKLNLAPGQHPRQEPQGRHHQDKSRYSET
ncbi:hypothetical protein D3C71_1139500 [compost metagenome]